MHRTSDCAIHKFEFAIQYGVFQLRLEIFNVLHGFVEEVKRLVVEALHPQDILQRSELTHAHTPHSFHHLHHMHLAARQRHAAFFCCFCDYSLQEGSLFRSSLLDLAFHVSGGIDGLLEESHQPGKKRLA